MRNDARQVTTDERRSADPREHLKLQMRRHGLSAPDLAEEFGIHPQSLYNVSSGTRRISSKLALKLAARFGEPVEYWLGEQVSPPPLVVVPDVGQRPAQPSAEAETAPDKAGMPPDVLVDTELRALVHRAGSGLVIQPFFDANVSPASYDLTIGLIVTKGFAKLDKYGWGLIVKYKCDPDSLRDDEREEARALIDEYGKDIESTDELTLKKHEAIGIVMREEVRFSGDFLARAGGTTKNALRGLMIGHGLQVDPGYSGPILITAFNIGLEPIKLEADQKILSLEIIRLRHSPETPYHEDTNSKIARIVERLSTEIADLFDYDAIANENRYLATLRANPEETFVCDGGLAEVRSHAVDRVVESCARGDSTEPFILPFTRAVGLVTIEADDAIALIRRFPGCAPEAQERARASFDSGHSRRTLKETLKKLDLEPGPAVAKLMGVKAESAGATT